MIVCHTGLQDTIHIQDYTVLKGVSSPFLPLKALSPLRCPVVLALVITCSSFSLASIDHLFELLSELVLLNLFWFWRMFWCLSCQCPVRASWWPHTGLCGWRTICYTYLATKSWRSPTVARYPHTRADPINWAVKRTFFHSKHIPGNSLIRLKLWI